MTELVTDQGSRVSNAHSLIRPFDHKLYRIDRLMYDAVEQLVRIDTRM